MFPWWRRARRKSDGASRFHWCRRCSGKIGIGVGRCCAAAAEIYQVGCAVLVGDLNLPLSVSTAVGVYKISIVNGSEWCRASSYREPWA